MKAKKVIVLLLAMVMVFTTACGGDGGNSGEAKDSITIGIDSDAVALDPFRVNDTLTMSILSNVYEPLVRMTTDSEIVPALASTWTVSDDGLEYTFTIHTDATFHNGDPITAEDVKYSLEMAKESAYTSPYMGVIDTVEVVDDETVKVTLQYAYAPFLSLCTAFSYVVSEDFYTDDGDKQSKEPIGSGPYKFVSWAQGDKIEFEAYDGYYGGEASIKNLTYKIIGNSTTAALALETGDIDINENVGSADIASFEDKEGITLLQQPSTAFYFVGMNTKVDKLSDVKVRQAIAKSINRQNMIDGALDGYGEPTTTFIAEGLPGYTEGFDPLPYDVDAAKELMAEAGYADGFDLTISVPEERSAQAQLVQADLAQIGINVTIDLIETGAFWDALENGDYEMMIMGWSYVVMDPDVGYYSLYKKDDISGNYTGFGNEETDGLLQQGRVSSDEAERAEIYAELEEIVMTEAPYVPLYWRVDAIAFNSDLEGVEIPPCGLYYVYDYSWK